MTAARAGSGKATGHRTAFAASPYPSGGGFPLLYRAYAWMEQGDLLRAEGDLRLCIRTVTKDLWVWSKIAIRAAAGLAEAAYVCGDLMRAGRLFGVARGGRHQA